MVSDVMALSVIMNENDRNERQCEDFVFFLFYVMPIYNLLRKGSNK